jgi:hypothetical protein
MTSSSLRVGDLNSDNVSDILFWYPFRPELSNRICIIRSERGFKR